MMKGNALAVVVSMAIAWSGYVLSVAAWSSSPLTSGIRASGTMGHSCNHRTSETLLHAAPDAPLFSDDLTGRTNHGPNPLHLTVKYKETMLRQAYDEWRAKYGRGDFDTERFRIFKFNFLASLRTHELQTSRAKIEGRPLPKLLELNAYGDCTKEEYLQLKEQESQNLVAPRTIVDANATATTTANVTASANSTATTATTTTLELGALPKTPEPTSRKGYSLRVDNRGPERERKAATSFPQRSTNLTESMTPLSPMTPKVPPPKSLQQQLNDLSRATNNLAPQPSISTRPPPFTSVGTASEIPKLSPSFLKPDRKGIFPERSASYFPKRTNLPKLGAAKSDQETKLVTNVNPNPGSSHVPPDQRGIFGEKSATIFPKRTEAHATPKQAQTTEIGKTTSTSPATRNKDTAPAEQVTKAATKDDSSKQTPPQAAEKKSKDTTSTLPKFTTPTAALTDQDKRDVTKVTPDATTAKSESVNNPKPTEETTRTRPPPTTAASTPILMPDTKDVPKIRTPSFSKQSQVPKKTGTINANETPLRPSSSVKPDVFYREQSALSFPKRTAAHQAPKVSTDAKGSETLSTTESVASPKPESDGTSVTREAGPRPSTNSAASSIKPDLFFQERSAMTFPKRTEAHKSRLPNTESERKPSPSLSYIKPDFRYPERSVTTLPQRTEEQFALVKAAMFRDDIVQTPPKTLLPDQSRANIADPFSFAKKKRDDLPPPDFEGQRESTKTKLENFTVAEPTPPVANAVESAPVQPKALTTEPIKESSERKSEKPEVQVSVPDMTNIQLKLAKLQTKESKPVPKVMTKPVPEIPTSETSTEAKPDQPTRDLAVSKVKETKTQFSDAGLKPPDQTTAPKDVEQESTKISNEKVEDKSSLEAKKEDLLHQALLKERMNLEQKSHDSEPSTIDSATLPIEVNASKNSESAMEATKTTKGEGVDIKDSTSTKTINKIDATGGVASKKQVRGDDQTVAVEADVKPASAGNVPPQAEQSPAVDKPTPTTSKAVKSEKIPEIDPLARQKEIEEALKADFSAAEMQSTAKASISPKATPNYSKSAKAGFAPDIDRLARQKEIEDALKAEYSAAASTTDRQKQIEDIFEGKVQVQATRPAVPFNDPFAVGSSNSHKPKSAPLASVEDILAQEMNAVRALQTKQGEDPALKAAEEVLKAPRTVSIHDILKAEMDAAKMMMKKPSSEADLALSVPLSNVSWKERNDAPAMDKADLKTKSNNGETKITVENNREIENPTGEEKPQNKKRKRKKKNKNKGAVIDAGVNGLSNTQINGQEKEP